MFIDYVDIIRKTPLSKSEKEMMEKYAREIEKICIERKLIVELPIKGKKYE